MRGAGFTVMFTLAEEEQFPDVAITEYVEEDVGETMMEEVVADVLHE